MFLTGFIRSATHTFQTAEEGFYYWAAHTNTHPHSHSSFNMSVHCHPSLSVPISSTAITGSYAHTHTQTSQRNTCFKELLNFPFKGFQPWSYRLYGVVLYTLACKHTFRRQQFQPFFVIWRNPLTQSMWRLFGIWTWLKTQFTKSKLRLRNIIIPIIR